jgi:type I restriction enzyme S subunit
MTTTIGEQATLQRGIDITQKQQTSGTVPVISSGGISSFHNVAAVSGPGVVLGRKGTVGTVFYVKGDFWPHDTTLWVKDFHGNDRRFVYYFFRSITRNLSALDVGTANPTLNRNHVHPLRMEWPALTEQRAIVDILGALDDKIELNRRMNQTLESMARAIFRSWLVDFDPVVAKAAGRQPFGMSADVAALFPGRFVNSAIGAIPAAWSTRSIHDVAHFVNGAPFNGSHFSPDRSGLPIIKIAELKYGITQQTQFTTQSHDEKYRLATGAILFSWSGSPETSIGTFVWSGGPGWLNQHIFRVYAHRREDGLWLYYGLLQLNGEFIEIARNKQTTGLGHVTVADLKRLLVVAPSDGVLAAFDAIVGPVHKKWFQSVLESRTLAALRDALLPKLMSGELRVRDAERLVGTHV